MRIHFNAYFHLATSLVFSSSMHHVTADSIRGTRSTSQTSSIEENSFNTRFLIPSERRLLPHEGVMRTLIIRVTDGEGKQPITDGRRESDTWFGTHDLALAGNQNSLVRVLSYFKPRPYTSFVLFLSLSLTCINIPTPRRLVCMSSAVAVSSALSLQQDLELLMECL